VNKIKNLQSPIIVVGRPRSGSSIFTRLLNESPDLCIVNDFYYLQYVDSLEGFSRQSDHLITQLGQRILLTLKDRYTHNHDGIAGIECAYVLTAEKKEKLETFVEQNIGQPNHNWASIVDSIMQYNSLLFGKTIWGYNTPQDYLFIPNIRQSFPNARFIYVMRDPREVLRSYKFVDYRAGFYDPDCYHPILQAIAWKSAMKSFLENQHKNNFLLVKYEDIINDVNQVFTNVGNFIGSKFTSINLDNFGSNSTFKNKQKKKINNTEIWLCEQICMKEMLAAGYSLQNCQPSIKDLGEMLNITKKSSSFYLKKFLASNNMRKRILNLARSLVK
jgi:hypothetical protein